MTIGDVQGVLHIGAPKCGSSALQAALSATPHLEGPGGAYRYVALGQRWRSARLLEGTELQRGARLSPYGYLSWPNLPRDGAAPQVWKNLEKVLRKASAARPILSSEGWVGHPETFAAELARMEYPRLAVFAYVRPPLEWLNAAYWQWGIWTGLPFDKWYERSDMKYRLGAQLEIWSAIPNVTLHIRTAKDDVVASLAADLQVGLPPLPRTNRAATPSLVGFLLRNRALFRPSPHAPVTEFIVQRWCADLPNRPLWALNHRDVHRVRGDNVPDVRRLLALLPDPEKLSADPRWLTERPYHERVRAGRSVLRDTTDLPALLTALTAGLHLASASAGLQPPAPPVTPDEDADLDVWDAAIAPVVSALIHADRVVRNRQGRRFPGRLISRWPGRAFLSG